MQEKGTCSPVEQDTAADEAIMGLLMLDRPALWSVEEVEREFGDPVVAMDSLVRLTRAGLVHRIDGFVFPTRAAVEARALDR